jgi:hypothetical protein
VTELAAKQHGVVAVWQLIAMGFTSSMVDRLVGSPWLHRMHRGVYAVGHGALDGFGRWMAGVLACGPDAVLSHQPAGALLDLRRSSSGIIHVTTTGRRSPAGLRVHRVQRLHPEDVTVRDGIPVTSVSRTLLDLAAVLPLRQLIRVVEQAERIGVFHLMAVERLLARSRGRKGATRLRQAVAAVSGEVPHVNSDWERDLLDFCDDIGVPRPELNATVEGFLVDALWPALKLIVELDSYAFHGNRRAFVEDRRKYGELQLKGYIVLPITRLDAEAARLITAAIAAR